MTWQTSTRTSIAMLIHAAASLAGCGASGLSYRERGGQTQGAYLAEMYRGADATTTALAGRAGFNAPAALAVAQVGEVSPPATMLARLRGRPDLFREVRAIPAVGDGPWHRPPADPAERRGPVDALRAMAGSVGADYLLLVGGTVDQVDDATPFSVLDLTIVGAFVIPSHESRALVKASGALIDVPSGRLVSISSAELEDGRFAPLAAVDGQTARLLKRMRDEVSVTLADAVAADCVEARGVNAASPKSAGGTSTTAAPLRLQAR